jgi:malonyl-CoA O-methyltransferase
VPEQQAIRNAFDRLAGRYDRYAALEQEVGGRLLERCDFQRLAPARIVDLGCGTGLASAALKRRYRDAQVIGLDCSRAMLARQRARSKLLRPLRSVCGDLSALPFAAGSVDLLYSNLACHWAADLAQVFDQLRRVLRPDGMLLFTLPGRGSLPELRRAWQESIDAGDSALPIYPDVLETGDALVQAGFREPVMDTDRITVHYPDLESLARELEATGAALAIDGWERWHAAADRLREAFLPLLVDGRYPLSWEIIYSIAFGPQEGQPRRTPDGEVATFAVDSLLKSRRMG